MRPVVHVPHIVLTTPSRRVVSFDKKLEKLITEMKDVLLTADNPKGVGLAAPQIGVDLQLFLIKPSAKSPIRVFTNPEILSAEEPVRGTKSEHQHIEGCLSIPGIWGDVVRSQKITLKYQDEKGIEHTEKFSGFPAVIIQHETDHVHGILFTQRVLEQKNKLFQNAHDSEGKEILEEIVI